MRRAHAKKEPNFKQASASLCAQAHRSHPAFRRGPESTAVFRAYLNLTDLCKTHFSKRRRQEDALTNWPALIFPLVIAVLALVYQKLERRSVPCLFWCDYGMTTCAQNTRAHTTHTCARAYRHTTLYQRQSAPSSHSFRGIQPSFAGLCQENL